MKDKPSCKYFFLIIILFTFICAESLLLYQLFSSCSEWDLLSSCSARGSHWGGFACYGAQDLGRRGFSSCGPAIGGIFTDQGLNLCFLHWQIDSLLLSQQGAASYKCLLVVIAKE